MELIEEKYIHGNYIIKYKEHEDKSISCTIYKDKEDYSNIVARNEFEKKGTYNNWPSAKNWAAKYIEKNELKGQVILELEKLVDLVREGKRNITDIEYRHGEVVPILDCGETIAEEKVELDKIIITLDE